MKFKPDLKIILATLLMLAVTLPAMSQGREIKGTVFESDGTTPVIGATVLL